MSRNISTVIIYLLFNILPGCGESRGKYQVPYRRGATTMALNVQFSKYHNQLIDEDVVIPRLVNQQVLDFNGLCEYLADGSTVTAADVSAVMKQIEMRLPLILGLNSKVVCSPEGLTFRPAVSGSITQSQLKAKLEARKAAEMDAEKAALIDVNRPLTVSDLTISDLDASISIDLPKKWIERFKTKAEFKRIKKADVEEAETSPDETPSGDDNTGGSSEGTGTTEPGNSGSTETGGTGTDNTGGDGDDTNGQLP